MIFSWQNEAVEGSIVDEVHVCRVDGRAVGKLHYYDGVGYFAYFRELQLNRTPVSSKEDAMNRVQEAYTESVVASCQLVD